MNKIDKVLEIVTEFSEKFNSEIELKNQCTIAGLSDVFRYNNISPDEATMAVFVLTGQGKLKNNIDDCDNPFDAYVIPTNHNIFK